MSVSPPRIFLVRHGATEWSVSRRHTGRTDLPLTDQGREEVQRLAVRLARERFAGESTAPPREPLSVAPSPHTVA